MTLYKIFKENEEKIENLSISMLVSKKGYLGAKNLIQNESKNSQLAIIDGVIAMVDSSKPTGSMSENSKKGIQWDTLNDLKDKLLAERKLIEENK